jgi:hypothetical protein
VNGEGIIITKENKKIFEIVKMYDQTGFPDDEMSIGYKINVFQETINKYIPEYLVNFTYFKRIMEDYGFIPIHSEEAKKMGLTNATAMFSDLYDMMMQEIERNPEKESEYGDASKMTKEERKISFLNRYFIFKKVRNLVNTEKIAKVMSQYTNADEEIQENYEDDKDAIQLSKDIISNNSKKEKKMENIKEAKSNEKANEKVNEKEVKPKNKTRKLKQKIKLETYQIDKENDKEDDKDMNV